MPAVFFLSSLYCGKLNNNHIDRNNNCLDFIWNATYMFDKESVVYNLSTVNLLLRLDGFIVFFCCLFFIIILMEIGFYLLFYCLHLTYLHWAIYSIKKQVPCCTIAFTHMFYHLSCCS